MDGTKCPPMLIFKGAAAADEVDPRHGAVARKLLDLQFNGVKYPDEVVLACNLKVHAYEHELVLTLIEQMKQLPKPPIVNCDDYKCHKSENLKQTAIDNGLRIYTAKGGLVIDCAANAIVHQHVEAANVERMLLATLIHEGIQFV